MNHQLLQFLHSLESILASPAIAGTEDANVKMHSTIANQLVGQMIVQETVLPKLKAETYRAYLDIIPDIERMLAGDDIATDLVRELADICSTAEIDAFRDATRLAGEIQQALLKNAKASSDRLCKKLVAIEAGYCGKRADAFRAKAEHAGSDDQNSGSNAMNAKEYDEGQLIKFMAAAFPGESGLGIVESTFVSGGYSKYTVAIKLAGCRSLPENIILRGDAGGMFGGVSVVKEYPLLVTLHEHGVCVPKPLALEASGQVFGSPFVLMEKKAGRTVGHMFQFPGANRPLCRDIATKLAQIHRVPVGALADKVEGANTSTKRKVLAWLDEGYAAWKPLSMPSIVYETAFQWLRANVGATDGGLRGLVHGDYGLNNILVDGDKASAILDWEFAHIANPAYDLGYFYFMGDNLASWEEFLGCYADAGGVVPDGKQLDYNILLATTRLNVMLCQSVATYFAGNTNLGVTASVGADFYDVTVARLAGILDRIM